ncbi:MAG: hypothetical protein WDW36_009113 [Sanguina aurantia]
MAPYTVQMDADTAHDLTQHGGTLLLLGVPLGTIFGLDQQAFVVGPKFKGVKMIPPGAHFVSYRAVSVASGDVAPSCGFFVFMAARQVVVRTWQHATESLGEMDDPEEAERYAHGVRRFDFDASLAPYNLNSLRQWRGLSCHISGDVIARLSPVGGVISVTAGGEELDEGAPKTAAEARLVSQLKAGREGAAPPAAGLPPADPMSTSLQPAAALEPTATAMAVDHSPAASPTSASDTATPASGPHSCALTSPTPTAPLGLGLTPPGRSSTASAHAAGATSTSTTTAAGDMTTATTTSTVNGTTTTTTTTTVSPTTSTITPIMPTPTADTVVSGSSSASSGGSGSGAGGAPAGTSTASGCAYTAIPRLVKGAGLTPAQLTSMNLDKSVLLTQLLQRQRQHGGGGSSSSADGGLPLLGELQFAFVAFLYGQSLQGFMQWKSISSLLLGCAAALTSDGQGAEGGEGGVGCASGGLDVGGGVLSEELLRDSFLKKLCGGFLGMLHEAEEEGDSRPAGALLDEAAALRRLLLARLGWHYELDNAGDDEDDEDGPVMVELD